MTNLLKRTPYWVNKLQSIYNRHSYTLLRKIVWRVITNNLGRHGLPVAEARFRVSPLLLLLSSGHPSASFSTHRTLNLLQADVTLPLASFALHDRKWELYDNTEIWPTLEQFIQMLCSNSHNLVLPPKLQDHCLNKYTHFILSKKHVCDENGILCSPSVLLSSHFNNTMQSKIKTWLDKKKDWGRGVGRL